MSIAVLVQHYSRPAVNRSLDPKASAVELFKKGRLNIFRLGNRTRISLGKTPLEVECKLLKRIPAECSLTAHDLLHGHHVCQAREPLCGGCGVEDVCGDR